MKIASIYEFQAYPPKGGNHLHALQLVRQFQAAGRDRAMLESTLRPTLAARGYSGG